ncbi:MAG: hypothetical protein IPK65_13990 [Gammaproteobacteria bacterium]|nr:hypothetical protein [Gammaproteobacteria bacterium]
MNEYEFEISFRVTHPSMSPDAICTLLSMNTDVKRNVGDARVNSKGKPLPGVWKETYCGFDVPKKEGDSIPMCLENMLNNLKRRRSEIEEIHSTGGTLEFYILSAPKELTFGEKFGWKILSELANHKIDLSLEIHEPN